ncbi:LuxR family transcriptional regulator [Patulibacter sp. SYSU D01012]|uniref:helix-turn-helix transcriptional regulator n=1 Tax=Patulibacter sp. SYSU D01012 TaxID=2817381 RepID=UPI001B30BAFC|nr:LuxR family transcriptional regulator [Patulibacter sp. SYSU D01012]
MRSSEPAAEALDAPAEPRLLEREAELRDVDAVVGDAVAGEGRALLLQGPAGIGKTALLDVAAERARAAGLRVLRATGSPLERDFPFGVVHQLLDREVGAASPERRERLLQGAAGRGAAVLTPDDGAAVAEGEEPRYAVLHGLYWLVANLADEGPLALVVDDLHWADRPSVRLVEYLARRLEGLPVALLAAARPGEPGSDADLLAAFAANPATTVDRPDVLGAEGAAALLAGALGHAPTPAFVAACATATGGNPFLLQVLGLQAAERGLRGTDDDVAAARAVGAEGLVDAVGRRLALLGPDARALAPAAALLGPGYRLDELAAVADVPPAAAERGADALVAGRFLDAADWGFVHPLLREAVIGSTPATARARLHGRAVAVLRARGARATEVALHHLGAAPAGDPAVVDDLRAAARSAVADGAPDVAIRHLRRALEEPPAPEQRPRLLLELGEIEGGTGNTEGLTHLTEALEGDLSGDDAARGHVARGMLLSLVDPPAALAEARAAAALAASPDARLRTEGLLLDIAMYHASTVDLRQELLRPARRDPAAASPAELAHLAYQRAHEGAPRAEVLDLARRAQVDGRLLQVLSPDSSSYQLVALALRISEAPEAARRVLDAGEELARRNGNRFSLMHVEHARAYWHLEYGSIAAGIAHGQSGLAIANELGRRLAAWTFVSALVELHVQAGDLAAAERVLAEHPVPPELEDAVHAAFVLAGRGLLRLVGGEAEEAQALLARSVASLDRWGWKAPLSTRRVLRWARALAAVGRTDEALALLDAQEALARGAGTDGVVGVVLATRGRIVGGDEGEAQLRAALALLGPSALRLDEGWAQHALGALLRRRGARTEARAPLRRALEIGDVTGAGLLAGSAREELAATGARALRTALSGPASLTPSERRVADLAAAGLTNRQIAERLWITRKTVELHLGHTYDKLGIRSRTQLPEALGAPDGTAPPTTA